MSEKKKTIVKRIISWQQFVSFIKAGYIIANVALVIYAIFSKMQIDAAFMAFVNINVIFLAIAVISKFFLQPYLPYNRKPAPDHTIETEETVVVTNHDNPIESRMH